jgi:hypothetical protein
MARYFCRLCFNTSNWHEPTCDAHQLEGETHAGVYAFGWEEWNFDFQTIIDARKYGWIEGFFSGSC